MARQPYILDMTTFSFEFLFEKFSNSIAQNSPLLCADLDTRKIERTNNDSPLRRNANEILNDQYIYSDEQ
jgi:hypothetical protein